MNTKRGALYLIPNTLDFGLQTPVLPIDELLPMSVLRHAARIEHWAVENAKTTRAFLKRVNAVVPLTRPLQTLNIVELPRSQKGSKDAASVDLRLMLAPTFQGHDLGLISEAGLPAVVDPGAALVQAAHAADVQVVALPGSSALLLALAASGLNGQSFAFVGYLPTNQIERGTQIRELETLSRRNQQTQLMIETPYRNQVLCEAMLAHLHPATRLSVSCGLTAVNGFTRTDTVQVWKARPITLPLDMPAVFSILAS